jgi:serine-type D-Ala-D-Ala carboxypeptidase (penicillin-binding protein 5/6)
MKNYRKKKRTIKKAPVRKQKSKKWFLANEGEFQLFLVSLILISIFFILVILNTVIRFQINRVGLRPLRTQVVVNPYPVLKNLYEPDISAQAAYVIDDMSQVVLYSKNADFRFSMASTTKIMTALTALDFFHSNDILTIKEATVSGTIVGFPAGEQLYFDDLLYAMMLPSGNDAAIAIADNYPGGRETFIRAMNTKARELQLFDTHFADPSGLNDDGDYTTVRDLARLTSNAIKNKTIARVIATKRKVISNLSGTREYDLRNLNRLLSESGVTGVKTGTTEGAGEVLVTSRIQNGHTLIIVVMKSLDRFADTQKLFHLLTDNVAYFDPVAQLRKLEER